MYYKWWMDFQLCRGIYGEKYRIWETGGQPLCEPCWGTIGIGNNSLSKHFKTIFKWFLLSHLLSHTWEWGEYDGDNSIDCLWESGIMGGQVVCKNLLQLRVGLTEDPRNPPLPNTQTWGGSWLLNFPAAHQVAPSSHLLSLTTVPNPEAGLRWGVASVHQVSLLSLCNDGEGGVLNIQSTRAQDLRGDCGVVSQRLPSPSLNSILISEGIPPAFWSSLRRRVGGKEQAT